MASRTATPSGVGGVKLRKPKVWPAANRMSSTAAIRYSEVAFMAWSSFRRNLIFDPLSPLRRFCIELQEGGPAIGCVPRGAHSIRACAMSFEVPVLKIHSRRAARHRGETDFHFARLSQVGLVAPSVCDLPCQHKAAR